MDEGSVAQSFRRLGSGSSRSKLMDCYEGRMQRLWKLQLVWEKASRVGAVTAMWCDTPEEGSVEVEPSQEFSAMVVVLVLECREMTELK